MAKDHGPSIKDDERYEALRREGASKEKAARIANTPAEEAGRRGGEAEPYEEWTVEELRERAAAALGPQFDLRRFHMVLLDSGSLPLDIVEENVDRWIAAEKGAAAKGAAAAQR